MTVIKLQPAKFINWNAWPISYYNAHQIAKFLNCLKWFSILIQNLPGSFLDFANDDFITA